MNREIDHCIGLGESGCEVFSSIVRGDDIDASLSRGFDDCLAHAAGFSGDKKLWRFRHKKC